MVPAQSIISKLKLHQNIFIGHLAGVTEEEFLWRPNPDHWCLLEIVCHLYDEEREDFRFRMQSAIENPLQEVPEIDPAGWIKERKYIARDYPLMVSKFINERKKSINWLRSHQELDLSKAFKHQRYGNLTAGFILNNWLAHDLLHIRQITRVKYLYHQAKADTKVDYAGTW